MSAYGCYVKFTAQPGQRNALVEHLLSAAALKQVLPLLAGSPEKIDVLPVGGKGLTLAGVGQKEM